MSRVDLTKLVEIEKITGYDVQIGSSGTDYGGLYITIRFSYWKELLISEIDAINKILGHQEIVVDFEDYDDDCGIKVQYKIVDKNN
tara:strand:+ start:210 stop:467 length:258 start_codon:yes stop_codon:yes gene_type:complete